MTLLNNFYQNRCQIEEILILEWDLISLNKLMSQLNDKYQLQNFKTVNSIFFKNGNIFVI